MGDTAKSMGWNPEPKLVQESRRELVPSGSTKIVWSSRELFRVPFLWDEWRTKQKRPGEPGRLS
jgi:hypothetical protein